MGVLMLLVFSSAKLNNVDEPVTQEPGIVPTPSAGHPGILDPSSQNSRSLSTITLVGSMIASVTSLIGFVTTTIITWRKEKREASLADVQRKKLETELEKSQIELEELKKSMGKKKSEK
jgi:hypothetical protein